MASIVLLVANGYAADQRWNPARKMAADGLFPTAGDDEGWATLPRLAGSTTQVATGGTADAWINTHAYVAWAHGRYRIMWSSTPGGEWGEDYTVRWASSVDGKQWRADGVLTASPRGKRRFARGFWWRSNRLLALFSEDEIGAYFGPGLVLQAIPLGADGAVGAARVVTRGAINNFAPERLADGRWMFVARNPARRMDFRIGGFASIDAWRRVALSAPERVFGGVWFPRTPANERPPGERWKSAIRVVYPWLKPADLDEPIWWRAADGSLVAMFRTNAGYHLYRARSTDGGRSWSRPVATNFPDTRSKISGLRLSNGIYALASNPRYRGSIRNPLMLSLSRDGLLFDRTFVLQDAPTKARLGNRPGYQYPHLFEHRGTLFVVYNRNAEDIEVMTIPIIAIADSYQPSSHQRIRNATLPTTATPAAHSATNHASRFAAVFNDSPHARSCRGTPNS